MVLHYHENQVNTCSTATLSLFAKLFPEANAVAIVFSSADSVSVIASRRGRFAGVALNIGMSGMHSLVAVPTN